MTINRNLALLIASVTLVAITNVSASEGPVRKAGLWEMKVQMAGHTRVTQICIDDAAEARLNAETADYMKANCSKNLSSREGNKYIQDTECSFSGTKVIGKSALGTPKTLSFCG